MGWLSPMGRSMSSLSPATHTHGGKHHQSCLKAPGVSRTAAPNAPVFLQMIMDFTSRALTLTPLQAKHVKPHPCQAGQYLPPCASGDRRQELSEVLSAITLENSLTRVRAKKLRKCQGTQLTYERLHKVNNLAHNLFRF